METLTKTEKRNPKDQIKAALEYAEGVVFELSGKDSSNKVDGPLFHAINLQKLLKALLTYSKIDLCFLDIRDKNKLPQFGIARYTGGNYVESHWRPVDGFMGMIDNAVRQKCRVLPTDTELQEAMRIEASRGGRWEFVSQCPTIPQSINDKHRDVCYDFSNYYIAWEAQWVKTPIVSGKDDPLLIGEIMGEFFLIAKWDMTKIESYIASEFTS